MVARKLVVVSGDPGMRCGWCVRSYSCKLLLQEGLIGALRSSRGACGEFRLGSTTLNVERHLDIARAAYEEVAEDEDIFVLVQESFTLRMLSMDPELLEPVRFNAILEDRLKGTGTLLEFQSPGDAKKTMTDQRLNLWGVSGQPGHGHAKDAERHNLLYARRWCADLMVRARTGWDNGEGR